MSITQTAAEIIKNAQANYGSADDFDRMIATDGIAPYGELYQETYRLANQDPVVPGANEEELAARKDRAAELWEEVLPELRVYADGCRQASYTGWSRESEGPVRRVRD